MKHIVRKPKSSARSDDSEQLLDGNKNLKEVYFLGGTEFLALKFLALIESCKNISE